jgi:hypothetical protein
LRVVRGRSSLTIEEAEDRGAMKEKKRSWRGTIRQHREAESQGRCDEGVTLSLSHAINCATLNQIPRGRDSKSTKKPAQ